MKPRIYKLGDGWVCHDVRVAFARYGWGVTPAKAFSGWAAEPLPHYRYAVAR